MFKKSLSFKLRKIVQYSLIICILLIQSIIAVFFYNEFVQNKNLNFIEKQLKEVDLLENLTFDSRKELNNAQNYFQKYVETGDKKYVEGYFNSVNKLTSNLDRINHFKYKSRGLQNVFKSYEKNSEETRKLKLIVDSTYLLSINSNLRGSDEVPQLKKYDYQDNFEKFEVQTKTYSDTLKKKRLLGRLSDAILGKELVRRDSVVMTVKSGKPLNVPVIKGEIEGIVNSINNHYEKEIQKIQFNIIKNKDSSGKFYTTFGNLLSYSNRLMSIYESAVRDSKAELEKEYADQNSERNKIRKELILGLMILMFAVSVLIMYFTGIAFVYEHNLKAANKQISENLNFKNRILGMLSHELRSPLKITGILINRINRKTNDENIKEYLKSISFTNNTLMMQANQILEYTKNQYVENKLVPVVFNLKNEIDSILTSIEPYIETRDNIFIIEERIDPEIMVYSDHTKINQIFMNILGNANKFTEKGKITVITSADKINENTVSLSTEVSDTGAGISRSDLEKIFEPYYQGLLSNEVENLGAGLGLCLCKEIIELYSGTISVTSEHHKGTTVSFVIHLKLNQ